MSKTGFLNGDMAAVSGKNSFVNFLELVFRCQLTIGSGFCWWEWSDDGGGPGNSAQAEQQTNDNFNVYHVYSVMQF